MITSYRKPLRAALLLSLATAAASTSFGFMEVARGALLLQTTASATYDSYFIGTVDNDPDNIYTLYPALRYTRNAGRGTISASAGVAFNRYEKNQDLDSDDLRANFSIQLPTVEGSRLEGGFTVDYNESTVVDMLVNDRVASESLNVGLGFEYRLNPRMTLEESLGYSNVLRDIYSDHESISNQVSFTYGPFLREMSLILSHDVTFTETSGDNFRGVGLDQESHNISLGVSRPLYGEVVGSISYGYSIHSRSSAETTGDNSSSSGYISASIEGPFLPPSRFPKLQSSASLTYSQSATRGLGDDGGKFLSGNLRMTWLARLRTRFNVNASRSLDLAATDLSVESTRVGAGFDQQIGRGTSVNGNVGYAWRSYRGVSRTDNVLDAGLGISRSFNKYLSAGANYTYQDNNNTSTGFQPGRFAPRNYERHTATGSITVTF